MQDWKNMIENRHTTFAWSDKEVSKQVIQDILDDFHTYCPSKQSMMPYTISVLDWSNPDLRNKIFSYAHRDEERGVDTDMGNPQTLAPWLLAFTQRPPVEDEEYFQYEDSPDYFTRSSLLEIGIATSFIVWSAAARGLNTGYCGCLNELEGGSRNIAKLLHPKETNPLEPVVLLGIGYKDETNPETYFDPRIQDQKILPTNDHTNRRRPTQDHYLNWMCS